MKDLINEGYTIQKKFAAYLNEANEIRNISKEYLQKLRDALILDVKKNPSMYIVNGSKPYIDDSPIAGATGAISWLSKKNDFEIYATPFWEDELGISVEVYNSMGNEIKRIPASKTNNIIHKLTTDLKKDINYVRGEWLKLVKTVWNDIKLG